MLAQDAKSQSPLTDVDLGLFYQSVRESKAVIFALIVFAVFAAIVRLHLSPLEYEVRLNVTMSERSGKLPEGGLSQILGGSGFGASSVNFDLYLEGIYSGLVAKQLAEKPDFLQRVFPEQWDATSDTWIIDDGFSAGRLIKKLMGFPVKNVEAPNAPLLQLFIKNNVSIDQPMGAPVASLILTTEDIEVGSMLLSNIHQTVERILKERAIAKTKRNIESFTKELHKTSISEYRMGITSFLVQEGQKLAGLEGSSAYAADTFGPPEVSYYPASPNPKLTLLGFSLTGLFIGLFVAFIRVRNIQRSDTGDLQI